MSDTPFRPTNAGNRARIGSLVDHLARQGWQIGAVLRADRDTFDWDVGAMRSAVGRLSLVQPHRTSVVPRWPVAAAFGRRAPGRSEPTPPEDPDWCPPWFRRAVAAEVRSWRPDVVLVEYVYLAPVLDDLRTSGGEQPLSIIDTHDVMSRRRDAYRDAGVPLQWFHASEEEERHALARADHVLAINAVDAAALARLAPPERIVLAPHGRDAVAAPPGLPRAARIVAIASRNDLNVAGLRWFLGAVWPDVVHVVPTAELVVCGTACEKLEAAPRVILQGFVPDLGHELSRARFTICPLGGGTGLKIKIVESLAHGRPVLTTPVGAAGFATGEHAGILVAETAADFARAALRLLTDDDALARATRGAVQHAPRFASAASFGALVDLLGDRLRTTARARR